MKKIVLLIVVSVLMLVGVSYTLISNYLHTPIVVKGGETIIQVEPGSSLKRISRELETVGVLSHATWLDIYARIRGLTNIKMGEYRLSNGLTPLQLLADFNQGNVIQHQVTLVDGKTFRDALSALQAEEKLHKSLNGLPDQILLQRLGVGGNSLEGLFFPDTYQYTIDMSDADVLKQAYHKMQQVLNEEWKQRDANLPYKNSYEALIMASIVEKETGAPEERPAIAGVFVRRLQKGMKLQTDPTVIYGLGTSYKGNLTRKHLLEDTPYNTYTRQGLPPTPIALPGREAIHAAMHPLQGDSLFFVGMGDGHHYFSATLDEHEKAVKKYQLTRKKDYHSAPDAVNTQVKTK